MQAKWHAASRYLQFLSPWWRCAKTGSELHPRHNLPIALSTHRACVDAAEPCGRHPCAVHALRLQWICRRRVRHHNPVEHVEELRAHLQAVSLFDSEDTPQAQLLARQSCIAVIAVKGRRG